MRRALWLFVWAVPACFLPEVDKGAAPDAAEVCLACAADQCPTEYDACVAAEGCEAVIACVVECPEGDTGCLAGCASQDEGVDEALTLSGCTETACPEDCPSSS